MRPPSTILLAGLAVSFAACAQGSQLETGGGGYGGAGAGGGATTSSSASSASSSGATSTSSSSSSSSSASSSGSSSSSSSSSSGGPTCDFDAPAPCPGAQVLQTIAGDKNHDTRTATGNTSRWFDVLVEEAVSSIIDYPQLSYTVTLASPPGTSYGLFVYTGDSSSPTCSGAAKQGTGNPAVVTDTWGDSIGSDDSTWITIEVRYLSGGACGPSDLWTLTVEGHTDP